MNIGMRLRLKAYAGDREDALALMNQNHEMFPRMGEANPYGSWALLLLAIEGLFVSGERAEAAALYPVVCELIATGTVCMMFISRLPQTAAGIAAAGARNWDAAEHHFRIAMEQAESFPNQLEQAEIRRFCAMMLLDHAAPEIAKQHEHYSTKRSRITRALVCIAMWS
jgi:nitrous oxide reductase accessory protein NosL